MKTLRTYLLPAALTLLLAACGGGNMDSTSAPPQAKVLSGGVVQSDTHPASDYNQLVEQLYIAYFGRPADPSGLTNFASQLAALGAPVDIQELNGAYNANSSLRALIDSFGDSDESKALYSGDNAAFVNAIYTNVLSRAPQQAGLSFWMDALNSGALTRANASLSIMAAALVNQTAQGQQDAQLIRNRVTVGAGFTVALDTQAEIAAYAGKQAAATARSMLASITAASDPASFDQTINATIATLIANAAPSYATVRAILNARCISCHSGGNAQAGVHLENDTVVHAIAQDIYTQVVITRAMPLGNATGMTDDERNTIKAWFEAGAK